jgi:hypothetical protein
MAFFGELIIGLGIGSILGAGARILREGGVFNPSKNIPGEMERAWKKAKETNADGIDLTDEEIIVFKNKRGFPK